MAITITGTLSTAELPRVNPSNQGQSIKLGPNGGTDLDSQYGLQTGVNGYQALNNFIAAWADSIDKDARAAMVQIHAMLVDMLNRPETTATRVYEP